MPRPKHIAYQVTEKYLRCEPCLGTGMDPESVRANQRKACYNCGGKGEVLMERIVAFEHRGPPPKEKA